MYLSLVYATNVYVPSAFIVNSHLLPSLIVSAPFNTYFSFVALVEFAPAVSSIVTFTSPVYHPFAILPPAIVTLGANRSPNVLVDIFIDSVLFPALSYTFAYISYSVFGISPSILHIPVFFT